MPGEPPCPPAANADDDATSNPAAHNKLIFVIDGVPLFCRKRPAFLIKPKRQIGFCSNWDCGMLSPWNYRPVRNPKVCARVGRPRRVGVVVQGCRYVRWRNSIKRLINPTTMHSTPKAMQSTHVAGPVPAIIQIAPAPMMPRETRYASIVSLMPSLSGLRAAAGADAHADWQCGYRSGCR